MNEKERKLINGNNIRNAEIGNIDNMEISTKLEEINIKLREDLTRCLTSYTVLLAKYDKLDEEYVRSGYEALQFKQSFQLKIDADAKKIRALQKELKQSETLKGHIINSFEQRISRLKSQLLDMKNQKNIISEKFNELKLRMEESINENIKGRIEELEKNKTFQNVKIQRLLADLDHYKTKLLNEELKAQKSLLERADISKAKRIKTKYHKLKFIGEPRNFQDIVNILTNIDNYPLKSQQLLLALEELCIYGNSNPEGIQKLRILSSIKYGARSLTSTDSGIQLRALHLGRILTENDERSCEIFLENGGMGQLLELLNSGDDEIRIETIYLLENLTLYPNTLLLFERTNLLIRVLLLLEEGLSLNSNFGVSQTMAALGVIRNYAKSIKYAGKHFIHSAIFQSIVKALELSSKPILRLALSILQDMNLDKDIWMHLNKLGIIPIIWRYLKHSDMIIKIESTNLLRKLTQYKVLNQEICQRLSLKDLSGILEGNNVEEFEENLLNSVINLCNDQTEAKDEFCAANYLREDIFNAISIHRIFHLLNIEDNVEVAKYSFKLLSLFTAQPRLLDIILIHQEILLEYSMECLRGKNVDTECKINCLNFLPTLTEDELVRNNLITNYNIEQILLSLLIQDNNININNDLSTPETAPTNEQINTGISNSVVGVLYSLAKNIDLVEHPNAVGGIFRDQDGFEILIDISNTLIKQQNTDWGYLVRIFNLFYFLLLHPKNLFAFKRSRLITTITTALQKAYNEKHVDGMAGIIRVLSFLSNDEMFWAQFLSRNMISALFYFISKCKKLDRKHCLSCIYDFAECSLFTKLLKEIPWDDSMGILLRYFEEERICTSIIMEKLRRDIGIRNQTIISLGKEEIEVFQEITAENMMWTDVAVPSHRNRLKERAMYEGNKKLLVLNKQSLAKIGEETQTPGDSQRVFRRLSTLDSEERPHNLLEEKKEAISDILARNEATVGEYDKINPDFEEMGAVDNVAQSIYDHLDADLNIMPDDSISQAGSVNKHNINLPHNLNSALSGGSRNYRKSKYKAQVNNSFYENRQKAIEHQEHLRTFNP